MAPIAVNTTEIEWSPAERFVSGSARQYAVATRPSVDVQSVPSFTAASNQANAGIPLIKENSQNQETENRCLTVWEVPVKEEAEGRGTRTELSAMPPCVPQRHNKERLLCVFS